MLRNRDGEPFTPEQYDYFNKTITEDFNNNPEIKKYNFKKEDIQAVSSFYFLLHMNDTDLKNNFIRKRFEQAQHLIYEIRKKDKDYKGKETLEKTIISITKKRFKNISLGKLDPKKYTAKKIMQYLVVFLNGERYSNLNAVFVTNFINKYKGIAQQTMSDLRIKTHKFKNTNSAKIFQKQLSTLYIKDTIDFENLYKFLAVTGKLNSNKKDLQWLSELTQILVPTIYRIKENIDKENEEAITEKELGMIKDLKNNDDLMLEYVLNNVDKIKE